MSCYTLLECKHWHKACTLYIFLFLCFLSALEHGTIDSLHDLETVSELALLRHHPQLTQDNEENVNQSSATFVQDLQRQNLTAMSENFNCSSYLKQFPNVFFQTVVLSKCMSPDEMLQLIPESINSVSEVQAQLCPILFLRLNNDTCDKPIPKVTTDSRPSSAQVWGCGFICVTVISCCSVVGVFILHLLRQSVYKTALVFFQGLAVGSLASSALLHLIPQTFQLIGYDRDHAYLWKSLSAFGGIYVFYLIERFMKIIKDVKEDQKKKKNLMLETENSIELLEFSADTHNGIVTTPLKLDDCNEESLSKRSSLIVSTENLQNGDGVPNGKSNGVVAVDDHNPGKLSHSDNAVHIDKGQSTTSTVAWMIIFGDGFHNFIDGLSIGAAFSESILAGLSISVAVFCEEFPHELGDLAVLLSTGMTMRQALQHNVWSAIPCYVGMILGVLLGDLAEVSSYVFAFAAGMFLYISLVSMMNELTEAIAQARKKGPREQIQILVIQNAGILLGLALLFLMARYADTFDFGSLVNSDNN